jgi:glyoxylase-like metal-dependent hydrolase (beta-lactamase superfamily II)
LKTTRIAFFAALLAIGIAGSVRPQTGRIRTSRVSDRVLVLTQAPWAETMTVVDAGPCLVVVDAWGLPSAAREAASLIDSLHHKPVRFVINTHHHWDHTFGNAAFPGAEIVGHRFCGPDLLTDYGDRAVRRKYFAWNAGSTQQASLREYIEEAGKESDDPSFRLVPPSRTVDERDTLRAGDLTFILYHTPGIHTRSNLTVFVPELGIAFGRREFTNRPEMKLEPGADPAVIDRVLGDIRAIGKPIRFLIPGHGDAVADPRL